jgi:ribosomal protein S18
MKMNYNEMFRAFDNGGETADRYTVFLVGDEEDGALGMSDDPSHPQGFSQWGDFDVDVVEKNNEEISFDKLPANVQQHAIDRFGLNEESDCIECPECGSKSVEDDEDRPEDFLKCVQCGYREAKVNEVWKEIILSVLEEDTETAAHGVSALIRNRFKSVVDAPLNEFQMGGIRLVGDDVIVSGKHVGTIENDLEDLKRGIVLKMDNGEEHDFIDIKTLMKFLTATFRVNETYITEATIEQKNVVKALRQLARKLQIPNPRFRSLGGKAGFVEMGPKNWEQDEMPNDLRKKVVVKVFNAIPQNFENVNYGNVRKEAVTLTVPQWTQLLSYYGISVPQPTETY